MSRVKAAPAPEPASSGVEQVGDVFDFSAGKVQSPITTGPEQARAQFVRDQKARFDGAVERTRRGERNRDATPAGRMHYDLAYQDMVKQAEAYCTCLPEGTELDILAYFAPVAVTEKTVKVRARVETPTQPPRPRGAGIAPGAPGSAAHTAWLNFQGATENG